MRQSRENAADQRRNARFDDLWIRMELAEIRMGNNGLNY